MAKKSISKDTIKQITRDLESGVGYGQPPCHSRFQKGQSGNPKGRPRKDKGQSAAVPSHMAESNAAIMSRVLSETVTVSRNGKRHKISKAEFVQRNTEKQAAEGSVLANRDLKDQLDAQDKIRRDEIEADHAWWRSYLDWREIDVQATSAKGLPPSRFWIDPEDIFFRDGQHVHVRGPLFQQEVSGFEILAREFQIRMVEWVGRTCFGRNTRNDNDLEVEVIFAALSLYFPARLRKACMATWDQLTLKPFVFWREFEVLRNRIWAEAGRTPPRRFLPPTDFSPLLVQRFKALRDSLISPLHPMFIGLAERHQCKRQIGRGRVWSAPN